MDEASVSCDLGWKAKIRQPPAPPNKAPIEAGFAAEIDPHLDNMIAPPVHFLEDPVQQGFAQLPTLEAALEGAARTETAPAVAVVTNL